MTSIEEKHRNRVRAKEKCCGQYGVALHDIAGTSYARPRDPTLDLLVVIAGR